ncbi:MAG: hypothetical protein JXR68_12950 [Bacteroidales bacterium]|nr:hypothetical protein [Bacteroidales bacterium]
MEKLTYEEIQKKVGNGWALLANIENKDNSGHFSHALLLYFGKNKKNVINQIDKFKPKYKDFGFFYFGIVPEDQIYIMNL